MLREIQELVKERLHRYFDNNDVEFFLGGSRRFNYENEESDYDLFVLKSECISEKLLEMGFIVDENKSYPGILYKFQINQRILIHVILLESDRYCELGKVHDNIENNLSSNITKILKYLRHVERFSSTRLFNVLKAIK